jgi:hypothetical protein
MIRKKRKTFTERRAEARLQLVSNNPTPIQPDFTPSSLHEQLDVITCLSLSFSSDKRMKQYRKMIYSVNKQGEYRYRTLRAENEMWGLVIWRMK